MIYDATVGGRTLRIEVRRTGHLGRTPTETYTVLLDGRPVEVDIRPAGRGYLSLLVEGRSSDVAILGRDGTFAVSLRDAILEVAVAQGARGAASPVRKVVLGPVRVVAPMPGRLVRVLVEPGQEVAAGQGLVVMEAMKMENEIRAPRAARVVAVPVQDRQAVETGALLVLLE